MDAINFGYSLKNIPIPSKDSYLKCLMEKVESLIKRMRWKAYFYETNQSANQDDEILNDNFGLKSEKCPPANKHLTQFEDGLYDMVKNINFKEIRNSFQDKLKADMKKIKSSKDVYVQADKTTNVYKLSKENYRKLLIENITKTYKIENENTVNKVDKEAKVIAEKLGMTDRMERYS